MNVLDLVVIISYVGLSLGIGIACRGKQDNTDDYFTAGGAMSGGLQTVLVGLSIAATLFSGVSFLAYPSVIYAGGSVLLVGLLSFPLAWVMLRYWFLPRYLAAGARKPYDIIEERFGGIVRTTAASLFLMLRVGWMAALIYAPTIAIMGAWQLDGQWFWPLVLLIGVTSTIYTALGGIRGVIVTDAIQFLVIALGIAFTIGYVCWHLPVSMNEAATRLWDSGTFDSFDLSLSTSSMTVWAVLLGVTVANSSSYMADQMSLQRYLAGADVRTSSRSFAINVVGVIVVFVMLAGVGLALRLWYLVVPAENLPARADEVMPFFIATELPAGVTGLIIAAILAATMSSMTSGINALASVITLDFRMRMPNASAMSSAQQVRFSRYVSLVVGLVSTLVAGLVDRLGGIFDIAQTLLGVFLGPLFACMALAILPLRLRSGAVLLSLAVGVGAGWLVAWSPMISLWVAPVSFAASMVTAVAGSMFMAAEPSESTESTVLSELAVGESE